MNKQMGLSVFSRTPVKSFKTSCLTIILEQFVLHVINVVYNYFYYVSFGITQIGIAFIKAHFISSASQPNSSFHMLGVTRKLVGANIAGTNMFK
jgi:hypothetical protein